jgi:predicted nuclease of predicted toxin-antitoxin system
VTLLFDQNVSARILRLLNDAFPGCSQVTREGLSNATDSQIWQFAKAGSRCIVTFDSDFLDLLTVWGFPPKIILLRFGNTSTEEIATALIKKKDSIISFLNDKEIGALEVHL